MSSMQSGLQSMFQSGLHCKICRQTKNKEAGVQRCAPDGLADQEFKGIF